MERALEAEIEATLKMVGLGDLTTYRNRLGDMYIPIRVEARAIVNKGDWKKNIGTALQDMAATLRCAQDKFHKVVG